MTKQFHGFENPFGTLFEFMNTICPEFVQFGFDNNRKKSKFDIMREIAENVEFEEIKDDENREQEPIKILE